MPLSVDTKYFILIKKLIYILSASKFKMHPEKEKIPLLFLMYLQKKTKNKNQVPKKPSPESKSKIQILGVLNLISPTILKLWN